MDELKKLIIFQIDDQHFALSLAEVESVIHGVEIEPLTLVPDFITGLVNFHGELLPVVNLRKVFQLPEREMELSDQLIITRTPQIDMVLWVDSVGEIVTLTNEEISQTSRIFLDTEFVAGVFKLNDGRVLIAEAGKFLTAEEIMRLKGALEKEKVKSNRTPEGPAKKKKD